MCLCDYCNFTMPNKGVITNWRAVFIVVVVLLALLYAVLAWRYWALQKPFKAARDEVNLHFLADERLIKTVDSYDGPGPALHTYANAPSSSRPAQLHLFVTWGTLCVSVPCVAKKLLRSSAARWRFAVRPSTFSASGGSHGGLMSTHSIAWTLHVQTEGEAILRLFHSQVDAQKAATDSADAQADAEEDAQADNVILRAGTAVLIPATWQNWDIVSDQSAPTPSVVRSFEIHDVLRAILIAKTA